jgi:hypothetical protein
MLFLFLFGHVFPYSLLFGRQAFPELSDDAADMAMVL